jgi:hypothetical protein
MADSADRNERAAREWEADRRNRAAADYHHSM